MASQLDNIVKAQRFNDLKAKISAECKRRKYVGSVEAFGGTAWDFENVPQTDEIIESEQYRKLSIPIRKINWKTAPNGPFDRIVNDADLAIFETKITAFKGRSITDQSTSDCALSCTGTCTTNCDTGCGGSCSGTCSGCKGSCTGSCKNTCDGGCLGCVAACQAKCLGVCGDGCQGQCTQSCANTGYDPATGTCNDSASCVGNCQYGCGNTCGKPASCGSNCASY